MGLDAPRRTSRPEHLPVTPAVQAISQLELTGNVIPHVWYKRPEFRTESGAVDHAMMIVCSDIWYWFRRTEVRDPATGEFLRYERKFDEDMLHYSYAERAKTLGLSKSQVENSIRRLKRRGLLRQELRSKVIRGTLYNNLVYVELIPGACAKTLKAPAELPPEKAKGKPRGRHVAAARRAQEAGATAPLPQNSEGAPPASSLPPLPQNSEGEVPQPIEGAPSEIKGTNYENSPVYFSNESGVEDVTGDARARDDEPHDDAPRGEDAPEPDSTTTDEPSGKELLALYGLSPDGPEGEPDGSRGAFAPEGEGDFPLDDEDDPLLASLLEPPTSLEGVPAARRAAIVAARGPGVAEVERQLDAWLGGSQRNPVLPSYLANIPNGLAPVMTATGLERPRDLWLKLTMEEINGANARARQRSADGQGAWRTMLADELDILLGGGEKVARGQAQGRPRGAAPGAAPEHDGGGVHRNVLEPGGIVTPRVTDAERGWLPAVGDVCVPKAGGAEVTVDANDGKGHWSLSTGEKLSTFQLVGKYRRA